MASMVRGEPDQRTAACLGPQPGAGKGSPGLGICPVRGLAGHSFPVSGDRRGPQAPVGRTGPHPIGRGRRMGSFDRQQHDRDVLDLDVLPASPLGLRAVTPSLIITLQGQPTATVVAPVPSAPSVVHVDAGTQRLLHPHPGHRRRSRRDPLRAAFHLDQGHAGHTSDEPRGARRSCCGDRGSTGRGR